LVNNLSKTGMVSGMRYSS